MKLTLSERDALLFYIAFSLTSMAALLLPVGSMGLRICLLVTVYNIALPVTGYWRKHDTWLSAWAFLLPLSILQVFPDWFLSAQLDSLVFPDSSVPKIGTVSAFMALMWIIPLFIIVLLADSVRDKAGLGAALAVAGLSALLIFGAAEMFSWRLDMWHAQNVQQWQHMALYVLPAELLLGVYTYAGFLLTRSQGLAIKLAAAASVMLLYLGALAWFYLVVETL